MKKRMMKLAALFFAASLTVVSAVPAFASSITLPTTGHTYDIYQVFTGTVKDGKLEDVKWGENGQLADGTDTTANTAVSTAILDELAALTTADPAKTDNEKLEIIEKYADLAENAYLQNKTTADGAITVPDGYYLVKDKSYDGEKTATADKALSTYMVKVVNGDITMTSKIAVPTSDKQVKDETADAEAKADNNGWGETADHAINETFQFKLIANLPDDTDIDSYKAYFLRFNDTMNKAVTFEKVNSVTVYESDGTTVVTTINTSDYALSTNAVNGLTAADGENSVEWTLTINDLKKLLPTGKSLKGLKVVVEYDAHLNENAVTSTTLETGDVNVNKVNLTYSTNPKWNGTGTPDTENTPDDYVFVFTYDLPNKKVSEDGSSALAGAEFKLYKGANTTAEANEVALIWDASLDNGKGAYRPIKSGEKAEAMSSSKLTDATFKIYGLDAGTYTLHESKVPDNYTAAADMTIVISGTHAEESATKATLTGIEKKVDGTDLGSSTNVIVNKKPSNLPSTGGMGTVMIYTIGGAMAIGAGSTLVVKKRVKKNK